MGTAKPPIGQRRAFLRTGLGLVPAALTARLAIGQVDATATRLPNGQLQSDAILKAEYQQNVKDARELTALSKSIELDFDKNDQNVLSVGLLKKLDDVEKIARRIQGRVRKN
jgi:hypothetical protein